MKFFLPYYISFLGTGARWSMRIAAFAFLLVASLPFASAASPEAIATFESLGLSWSPQTPPVREDPLDPESAVCSVQYRRAGESVWKDGFTMWYDQRDGKCRGSLVHLTPETTYEVLVSTPSIPGQSAQLTATTWSEIFPIARTEYLTNGTMTQTLEILPGQGGTPSGYVLYTFPTGGQTTIDVANAQLNNIRISAPYVIVRGLTLKGAQGHAIALLCSTEPPTSCANNVVIEDNDISGWGSCREDTNNPDRCYTNPAGWQEGKGYGEGSGIMADCLNDGRPGTKERIIIQRNRIHDPRYGAGSWDWGHPDGPNGIAFINCGGNNVLRYNEVYSNGGEQHYFMDGMGGGVNVSTMGFPGADSDIYGNIVMNTWDEGIEAEGGGRNVRVWGNYLDRTAAGIASAGNSLGPLYIFRNVYNRSRFKSQGSLDLDERSYFAKAHGGDGRRYFFHNTLLQAEPPLGSGNIYPQGAGAGISPVGAGGLTNAVSRNNILHVWKGPDQASSITDYASCNISNDFQYDLYNGKYEECGESTEPNGIPGTPVYALGHGWANESGGLYSLAPNTLGYDQGVQLANFNDGYLGAAPDVGAHEAGSPPMPMRFGVKMGQYLGVDVGAPVRSGLTSVFTAGSAYDVEAGGRDIYGTSDQFHYAYNVHTGDFDLRVRVSSLTQANMWSKAGLMARESMAAGSRMVSVHATPATGFGGYEFMYRDATGAFVQKVDSATQVSYPNTWVRLKRVLNEFSSYTSSDGANWVALGATTLALPGSVYLGMVVSSNNENQTVFAEFRDLGTRFEEATASLSSPPAAGSWSPRGPEVAAFSGGSAVSHDKANATAAFTFTGTAVSWIGLKCNVCGIANVSIDGGTPTLVNTAGTGWPGMPGFASEAVFTASGLAAATHTIVITVTGTTTSGGTNVAVDAFDVVP